MNQALARYGIELSRRDWIERCVGHKARDFLGEILGDRVDPSEMDRLLVAKSNAYQTLVRELEPPARSGIPELLQSAADQGFRCAIASATSEPDIRATVERLGLAHFFDAIVSVDAVARPKPAPDVYLRAAELLQVAPPFCVVVEDTSTGLASGRAAGMRRVAFPNEWTAKLDFGDAELIVPTLDRQAVDRILGLAGAEGAGLKPAR